MYDRNKTMQIAIKRRLAAVDLQSRLTINLTIFITRTMYENNCYQHYTYIYVQKRILLHSVLEFPQRDL